MSFNFDNLSPDDHDEMESVSEYTAFSIADTDKDGMMNIKPLGTDSITEGSLLDKVGTSIYNILLDGEINKGVKFDVKMKGLAMITLELSAEADDKIDIACMIDPPAQENGIVSPAQALAITAVFSLEENPDIGIENLSQQDNEDDNNSNDYHDDL